MTVAKKKSKTTTADKVTTASVDKSGQPQRNVRKKASKKKIKAKGNDKNKKISANIPVQTNWQEALSVTNNTTIQQMPQSSAEQQELLERANILAKRDDSGTQQDKDREMFILFQLGSTELYGIPHRYAKTVVLLEEMAIVPGTPAFIAGVVNHGGKLLTVIDLKYFFHTHGIAAGADTWIIVVQWGEMTLGVLADSIEGADFYSPSGLAAPHPSAGVTNLDYVEGIHQGKIAILNMEALLQEPALTIEE